MRRAFLRLAFLLGASAYAFAQAGSSESQTLQALLNEVRALRQDLRVSLNRTQTMQILLARLQMQEGVIARSTDHLNDVRQKLLEASSAQKQQAFGLKQLEDSLEASVSTPEQADLQDRIKHAKSNLEVARNIAQQQQTAEVQAEQQLRDEQDKLRALEAQLDDLIRGVSNSNQSSGTSRRQ